MRDAEQKNSSYDIMGDRILRQHGALAQQVIKVEKRNKSSMTVRIAMKKFGAPLTKEAVPRKRQ